jgi:hypothetical protein
VLRSPDAVFAPLGCGILDMGQSDRTDAGRRVIGLRPWWLPPVPSPLSTWTLREEALSPPRASSVSARRPPHAGYLAELFTGHLGRSPVVVASVVQWRGANGGTRHSAVSEHHPRRQTGRRRSERSCLRCSSESRSRKVSSAAPSVLFCISFPIEKTLHRLDRGGTFVRPVSLPICPHPLSGTTLLSQAPVFCSVCGL